MDNTEKRFKLTYDKRFLIVGLGLMGGSYAQALTRAGFRVEALTDREEDLTLGIRRGMVTGGRTVPTQQYVSSFDIVIFALYPTTFISWIENYGQWFKKGAVLTDVTGIKGPVVEKVQSLLPEWAEFIAAHPMAGRETSGLTHSSFDIFKGANYIVTPTPRNTPGAVGMCRELGHVIGCGRITELSPEEHDDTIGFLSQLAHCIAVSLMTCRDCTHLAAYSGDSFRDLTRIAKINENMWPELFIMNRKSLLHQMDLFEEQFDTLRKAVEDADVDKIREMMVLSTSRRESFDK